MEGLFLKNDIETVGSKPTGLKGTIAGRIMNIIHAGFYKKIITDYIICDKNDAKECHVLDIGCGGGITLKLFSSESSVKKTCGIDYSIEMVKLAKKLNQKKITKKTVEILKADVLKIPYGNDSFNIVTAFDTINFWPDHNKALSEIKRVLKINGKFFIINAYPREGTKWHDFVKFKNNKEYEKLFSLNGFVNINSFFVKNTIIVSGNKP